MIKAPYTLVIGATTRSTRYAYIAINRLLEHEHAVYALGITEGSVSGVPINTGYPEYENVHTVTLYINPQRQPAYYDYIVSLQPKRIIFNPGTENPELAEIARNNNIEVKEACTLVMLSTSQY